MSAEELHYKPLKLLLDSLEESSGDTKLEDLIINLQTNIDDVGLTEAQELTKKYIEEEYIEVEDYDDLTPDVEVEEVHLEQFKADKGIREQFPWNKSIMDDVNSIELAHKFSRWIRSMRDVASVVIDVENDAHELWRYDPNSKTWKRDGSQKLREALEEELEEYHSTYVENQVRNKLKGYRALDYDKFGADKPTIAVENGVLDLEKADPNQKKETPELKEIEKDDYISNKLPVEYDPQADIPQLWRDYLRDSVPEEQQIKKLQEFAGYCLQHWTAKYEKGLMLLGPTDSGKSVFLETVETLLGGDENVASEALQELADTRWAVANLRGMIANIRHDLDPAAVERIGLVKELTSGNPVTAEFKGEQKFKFEPKAKHLFSANRVPDRSKEDDAYYNRWLTVIFPQTVPEEDQDTALKEKLQKPEKLSGILNWAIMGYKRLEQQEQFTGSLDPMSTKELWQEWGNSVERFISRYCDVYQRQDPQGAEKKDWKVHISQIYPLYEKYASKAGLEVVSKKQFTKRVTKFSGVTKGQPMINGNQKRGYWGLKLSEDAAKRIE